MGQMRRCVVMARNSAHVPTISFIVLVMLANSALCTWACTFPDYLQDGNDDLEVNWHSRIRNGRLRETAYVIRHNVIDIRHVSSSHSPSSSSFSHSVRWKCALTYHGKFLLKRKDPESTRHYSACVKFLRRSASVVQMMWSPESDSLDPALCQDDRLQLDPWPLVSFKRVTGDYSPSPFSGGYSMRITDSQTGENGCNYMHRPMKFESDCLTGEGVVLDFMSENCLPTTAAMLAVRQRTIPVASWRHQDNHYVILRRRDAMDLFCLRMPASGEDNVHAFLFTDLVCLTEKTKILLNVPPAEGVKYLMLHLQRYVYRHLCDDEYPQCSAVTCNRYIRHECHKSCKVCDLTSPPPTCTFPRRLRGMWYQTDSNGFSLVNITETDLNVEKVGHFRCVTFPDSPQRKMRAYTTVSTFNNGCRPRYTCVKLKRLGPAALRYTLSRSYVWPHLEKDFGQAICSPNQFGMDPEPINDLYRSAEDTGKAIISDVSVPERVPCELSSSFTVTAALPNGSLCHGSLYQHCEDDSRLRLQFQQESCGHLVAGLDTVLSLSPFQNLNPSGAASSSSSSSRPGPFLADYSCLAQYDGHYWERILLLQNVNDVRDARCLFFSQLDVSRALMLVAGQCDKNSWNYASAGLRTPLLTLQLRPDEFPCRFLPATTPPPPSPTSASGIMFEMLESGGRYRGTQRYGKPSPSQLPPSVSYTVAVPGWSQPSSKQRISAAYEEPRGEDGLFADYKTELSPAGNNPGSSGIWDNNAAAITGVGRMGVVSSAVVAVLATICLSGIYR